MFTYYRFSKLRILLAITCALAALFAPWWAALIFAISLNLRFRAWEVILIGLFMDLYWMPFSASFFSFDSLPLATIIAIILVFGFEPLRRQLLVGPEIA